MTKYVIRDMAGILEYAAYGALIGTVLYLIIWFVCGKCRKKECRFSFIGLLFWIYISILLVITFFSREAGTDTRIDLQIGSSFGINTRNDAYIIENILLFIPYGFLFPLAWKKCKGILPNLFIGFITSLLIETLQLASGRGIFQIDDMITNTLGALIGYLLFWMFDKLGKIISHHL